MSISQNFPEIKPSLNLDFANVKALDSRVTFSRASSATYYGTQTAKAEENLLRYSQEFDNAAWDKSRLTVTANDTTAPDGTTTAELITLTAETGIKVTIQNYPALSNGRMMSVFAKAGTLEYIQLYTNGDAGPFATFDLTSGAGAVGSTGSNQTASIVDVGNDWFRCSMYTDSTTAINFAIAFVSSSSAARLESWTSAGTETVYLWGAQLEQR